MTKWDLILILGFACFFGGMFVLAGWAWTVLSMGVLLVSVALLGALAEVSRQLNK